MFYYICKSLFFNNKVNIMSPELITLIAMFTAIVGIFINQSNKFDKLNDKIDKNHKELSREITNIRIQVNRI